MNKEKALVKLINVKDLKQDMETITRYCDFINKTLKKLSKEEEIYLEDLNECIDKVETIRSYANAKAKGDELHAKMSFIFGEM